MLKGQCHCGNVRFQISGPVVSSSLCHCSDCRKQSGAPLSAWALVRDSSLKVEGMPTIYASSENGRRSFCASCGTGLFFTNDILMSMDMVQVRAAALDDPNSIAPQMQVQTAERLGWMAAAHELPAFDRFPP